MGYLNIDHNNYKKVVHPDDIKKLKENAIKDKFICLDLQFQYLIISNNNNITIRVLPSVFKMI